MRNITFITIFLILNCITTPRPLQNISTEDFLSSLSPQFNPNRLSCSNQFQLSIFTHTPFLNSSLNLDNL